MVECFFITRLCCIICSRSKIHGRIILKKNLLQKTWEFKMWINKLGSFLIKLPYLVYDDFIFYRFSFKFSLIYNLNKISYIKILSQFFSKVYFVWEKSIIKIILSFITLQQAVYQPNKAGCIKKVTKSQGVFLVINNFLKQVL